MKHLFRKILLFLGLAVAAIDLFAATSSGLVAATAAPAANFVRTIYLIRHGNYTSTEHPDGGPLSPLGIAQARLAGARLRGMPVAFTSLTSSTMVRARQTAAVIGESLPELKAEATDLLRECTPRSRREPKVDEKAADFDKAEAQLNDAFATYFVPAKDRDKHDLIVCHGNVIRYFVTKALGVDTQAWLGMSVAHGSLTIITVSPQGAFKVLAVGDIGHIPPNLQSDTSTANPLLILKDN